jgi:hypothetical protein
MANKNEKNIISEKMEAVKKWWDSDTTKAISTIIAVLLIPGAVLAWNYASGKNVNVEENILEGQSTTNEDNDVTTDSEEVMMAEDTATTEEEMVNGEGESVMQEETVATEVQPTTELEIGGIDQVTTLPNTTSKFE